MHDQHGNDSHSIDAKDAEERMGNGTTIHMIDVHTTRSTDNTIAGVPCDMPASNLAPSNVSMAHRQIHSATASVHLI